MKLLKSNSYLSGATHTLLNMLAQTVPERDLLQASIETLADLIQAKRGAIGVLDEGGKVVRLFQAGDVENGVGCHAEGSERGLFIRNSAAWRVGDSAKEASLAGSPFGHAAMTSMLAVPVSSGKRTYATVYLYDKLDRSEFSEEDEEVVSNFADALISILEKARRRRSRKRGHGLIGHRIFGRRPVSCPLPG